MLLTEWGPPIQVPIRPSQLLPRSFRTQQEPNDVAVTQAMSKQRKALADVGREKGIIETIRKVGYLVTADV